MTFREGEVSFQATCNTMSGDATLEDDVLVVDSVGGTEMGCPGAGFEQDEWLVDFFTSRPADGRRARRRLRPDPRRHDRRVPLARGRAGPDDVRLGSVVWQLTGIEQTDGDAVSMMPVVEGTVATVDITGTRFRMETGCNSASSTVHVDDDSLQFNEILVTERGCADGIAMDQERLQLSVLGDGLGWSVDGDQLRLSRGGTTLLYRAGCAGGSRLAALAPQPPATSGG